MKEDNYHDLQYHMEDVEDEQDNQETLKSGWKFELFDLVKTFMICFVSIFLITTYLIKPVTIHGKSMYPTLKDKDVGAINVISRKVFDVERFDVVVAYRDGMDWVKRVIGLPGDRVYAKDDVVYVNGKPIEEPYLNNDYVNKIRARGDKFTQDFDEVILGEDEYFLMGDNRIISKDSRDIGPFLGKSIVGKDVYVVYPFNDMKIIRKGE